MKMTSHTHALTTIHDKQATRFPQGLLGCLSRTPGAVVLGLLALALLPLSCTPTQAVRTKALKSASLEFRFSPGHESAGLELHLKGTDGATFMTLSLARDGRLWSGRLSDKPGTDTLRWVQGEGEVQEHADDGSSPDEGTEFQAPDLDSTENEEPADDGDSPMDPPVLPSGFMDLPLLGRFSSNGEGDGWVKGNAGIPLVLKRSALQDLAGIELVLMEGTCKIINISWKELGGTQRMAMSLLEPGYVELAPLVSGMGATDEALVLELNGGDGVYGTDAGLVEVRAISRELSAAGWQETHDQGPENPDAPGVQSPAPDTAQTEAWHTVELVGGDKILSLRVDGLEVVSFDLGGKTWTGLEVLAQNLPGAEYRALKVQ